MQTQNRQNKIDKVNEQGGKKHLKKYTTDKSNEKKNYKKCKPKFQIEKWQFEVCYLRLN